MIYLSIVFLLLAVSSSFLGTDLLLSGFFKQTDDYGNTRFYFDDSPCFYPFHWLTFVPFSIMAYGASAVCFYIIYHLISMLLM